MNAASNILRDLCFYFSRHIGYPLACPDVLQLSITSQCNLRCKSCNVWQQDTQNEQSLTLDEIEAIFDESARWGIKETHLLGGEPLLHAGWEKIVSSAKKKGMTVVICSNGTLINPAVVNKMVAQNVDVLCISLDGAKKETHDFLRGQEGAYERILQGISALNCAERNKRPKLVLILTVSNKNFRELREYVDLARVHFADGIYFTALVLDNVNLFSQKKIHDLWIEDKDFAELDALLKELDTYATSHGYLLGYPSFRLFSSYFQGQLRQGDWICFSGLKRIVVTPSGDIQICGEIVGNFRKTRSLKKIWASYAAYKKRRAVLYCKNYCLQDCHSRQESNYLSPILKRMLQPKKWANVFNRNYSRGYFG